MGEGDIFQLAWPWTISLHVEKTREKKKAQEEERGAQGVRKDGKRENQGHVHEKSRMCYGRIGTVTTLRGGKHVESCELASEHTRGGSETQKQLAKVRRQRGKENNGASAQFVVHRRARVEST